ncbi:MAG: TonB family protein [Rhodoferax sp.]
MTRWRATPLHLALLVSVALHAAVLTLRWADPQALDRVVQDSPLEVVLVNARSREPAEVVQALAQAHLAGGGEAAQGRVTSPLPPAPLDAQGEDADAQRQRQVAQLQEQQAVLLSRVKQSLAALPALPPQQVASDPELAQREQRRRELIALLAEIERRINAENARPRKRYISPATREVAYAAYYDRLRRAIEDKGTENFPQDNGQKLYGELTMIVTVNHDGRVLATEVVQGSGNPALDRRARAIVRSAAPFGPFSPEMRRLADQIAVVSRFKFTRDDTLQTRMSAP